MPTGSPERSSNLSPANRPDQGRFADSQPARCLARREGLLHGVPNGANASKGANLQRNIPEGQICRLTWPGDRPERRSLGPLRHPPSKGEGKTRRGGPWTPLPRPPPRGRGHSGGGDSDYAAGCFNSPGYWARAAATAYSIRPALIKLLRLRSIVAIPSFPPVSSTLRS